VPLAPSFCRIPGFSQRIDAAVPADLDIHLVLDNYGTHKTALIRRWLLMRPRYHLHFTPTHASWLNQAERWFALLTERQIKRGSHRSAGELEGVIHDFIKVHKQQPKPFRWTKSASQILASIARFTSPTLATHRSAILQKNQ
jgi:transposase